MRNENAPGWMLCEDMITRLKDELILEAIDILHDEMNAGRIDISGYISLLPDKSNEIQRDMYIIGNLIQREREIMEQYRPYLEKKDETDPEKLKRLEELKKFVLSVGAISMLMRFSHIAEKWADDTGKYSELDNPEQIIINTAKMADERIEVLEFALSSSKFMKSDALKKDELQILQKALKECGP